MTFCLSPRNAQAQDSSEQAIKPWTFEFGAGYIGELASYKNDKTSHFGGVNMNFAINQKLNNWVSLLAFEASLRVIITHSDDVSAMPRVSPSGERLSGTKYCDAEGLGGSLYIAPRFYFISKSNLDFYGKLGLGIILGSYNDRVADLGIRFGLGANFWLTDLFGIGVGADYDLAVLGTRDVIDELGKGKQVGYVDLMFQISFRW